MTIANVSGLECGKVRALGLIGASSLAQGLRGHAHAQGYNNL